MTPPDYSRPLELFRELAADPRTVVLDTETTSLQGEAVEIAVVDLTRRRLFHSLVQPTEDVTPGAYAVHGIGRDELRNAPTILEVWPRLMAALEGRRVAIYNAGFDLPVLRRTRERRTPGWAIGTDGNDSQEGLAWGLLAESAVCVMRAYAPIHGRGGRGAGGWKNANLQDACLNRGVPIPDHRHRATVDCVQTVGLIHACAQLTPEHVPHLSHVYGQGRLL